MKILMTGGHLSPAISVLENLPKDAQVFFVGRKNSFEGDRSPTLEYQTIRFMNIPFINLPSARFQRKFTIHTIPSLFRLPYVLGKSLVILRDIKPDVVLGFGGYVSLPICLGASILGIPVVIHEQTLEVGLANKIIGKWARGVCISWPSSAKFFSNRNVVLTGNPIRKEILEGKEQKAEEATIYITGGSSGSHFINKLVEKSLSSLLKKYTIIHQTGDSWKFNDFERLDTLRKSLPRELAVKYTVKKFFENSEINQVLRKSSLVIGRAGINIITELLYLNKPAFLIPLSISQNNEQTKNALFMKNLGLCQILSQNEISEQIFMQKVESMMKNIENFKLNDPKILESKNPASQIISVVYDTAKKAK